MVRLPPKLKFEGKLNGLYVTYKPEDHDEWKKKQDAFKLKKKGNKLQGDDSKRGEAPKKRLGLANSLKTVLMTHCEVTESQATAIVKEAEDNAGFC